jgi:hypothetical protein
MYSVYARGENFALSLSFTHRCLLQVETFHVEGAIAVLATNQLTIFPANEAEIFVVICLIIQVVFKVILLIYILSIILSLKKNIDIK